MNTPTENIAELIILLILIVLCAGTPDLLDAIIAWIGSH